MTDFRICNKWYIHVALLLWNKCLCLPSLQNSYVEAQYPDKVETLGSTYVEMRYEGGASMVGSAPLWGERDRGPSLHWGGQKTATCRPFTRNRVCRPLKPANPQSQGEEAPAWGALWRWPQLTATFSKPRFLHTRDTGSHTVYLRLFCLNWHTMCYYWLVILVIKVFVWFFTITGSEYICLNPLQRARIHFSRVHSLRGLMCPQCLQIESIFTSIPPGFCQQDPT